MDWIYRDLDRMADTLADCLAGRPTCDYQPGHPHGFHNHIYAGEIHHCRPPHDPRESCMSQRRSSMTPRKS